MTPRAFKRTFAEGREGEEAITRALSGVGFTVERAPLREKTRDLDVRGHGLAFSLEVKRDLWQTRTGNLALEYRNPNTGEPSGVLATRADLFAFVLGGAPYSGVWVARSGSVRSFFFSQPFLKDIHRGGDGNASFRLYRDSHLLSIFRRLDGITKYDALYVLSFLLRGPHL